MEEVLLYRETCVVITYHPISKMVKLVWNGTASKEQYQEALQFILDYQEKSNIPVDNYLSDILKQGIVNPESRKWFEHVAIPRAINQGLKRAAVVFDGNVFKKYYLNLILQVSNAYKLPLKFFSTQDEVIQWFNSFNK